MLPNLFVLALAAFACLVGENAALRNSNKAPVSLPYPPPKPPNCEPGSKCFAEAGGNTNPQRRPVYKRDIAAPVLYVSDEANLPKHSSIEAENEGRQSTLGASLGRSRRGTCDPNKCDSNCRYCFNGKCDCKHH